MEDFKMGLRIQNNIAAMNAHRNLQTSDTALGKSLEKLSSGFRINKAADDAAGLAISQSFRADIASYKVASRNTSEASSLLQVAEGATDQIGSMLTRLKELATQAASANAGSNTDKISAEAQKVTQEIDRIANSTKYAGSKLIDGSFGVGVTSSTGNAASASLGYSGITGMKASETYNLTTTVSLGTYTMQMTTGAGSETVYFTAPSSGNTKDITFSSMGVSLKVNDDLAATLDGSYTAHSTGNSAFQVGADNNSDNRISISLGNATTSAMGIASLDLGTATGAQNALTSIDSAISSLNSTRGSIGAFMNRLSYAAANLSSTIENVTAAESTIRDVDMADEMTSFTKNQILLQAGTAMLAQANQAPQGILSLLQ
jgi:flagellin